MNIPTTKECYEIMDELEVPERIRKHSEQVTKIAVLIASKLKEKGIKINIELVEKSSLLHDIDKLQCLEEENHMNHGIITEKILKEKGYPEVGEIIRHHVTERETTNEITWEIKCLRYGDSRVIYDKIVPIKERLEYAKKRYPKLGEDFHKKIIDLEKEIFKIIDINPEDIK